MQLRVARHPERLDEVVGFYRDGIGLNHFGDDQAVQAVAPRLGVDPTPPINPYWAEHGVTFEDPEG